VIARASRGDGDYTAATEAQRFSCAVPTRRAVVKANIVILSPTQLLHLLLEHLSVGLTFRIIPGAAKKHANVFYPIRLLRFRGERPRSRNATNQCDELAPLHCQPRAQDRAAAGNMIIVRYADDGLLFKEKIS
jgi:hypothetical protein